MKELPTGVQIFENIRRKDGLYVDKTDMIYDIVSGLKSQYFLSRPRRFGKSLLCWTLDALFSGKKKLFEGLAISKTDWVWECYPVIHLDMSKVDTAHGTTGLDKSMVSEMMYIAREHEINLHDETLPADMLKRIIVETSQKHGKPAVVIVDEYDRPFLDFYNKPTIAKDVRDIMRSYYTQLKANEKYMRFLFLTGISKFSKIGVFSTLNNLNDLSLDEDFGTLLGYTEDELTGYFDEYFDDGARKLKISVGELVERIRNYYNGFCFDGVHKVYNPFSVLNFFGGYKFLNYWMESANPKMVADYMKDRHLTVEQFRGLQVSRDFAHNPGEIETAPPESFLYQAGYLTLREGVTDDFSLNYPNTEVLNAMSQLVYTNMLQTDGNFVDLRTPLLRALCEGNSKLLIDTFNRLLASIPYDDYTCAAKQAIVLSGLEITTQEWLYRSTILAFLRGCNVMAFGEMHSNKGRSDLQVMHKGIPWVIEIKIARNDDCAAKAREAMEQINANQYAYPYTNAKKVAIAIDEKTRQIVEWIEG